jgi:hypothetical protein
VDKPRYRGGQGREEVNRRSFLTLGLRSIVLATAVSTGLARVTLNIADNRNKLIDLLEKRIIAANERLRQDINNQLFTDVFSKGTVSEGAGLGGLIQKTEWKWTESSIEIIA